MIVLRNACVVQFHPPSIEEGLDVVIDKGMIVDVGKNCSFERGIDRVIDLHGNMVSPGLVCSHNHFYSALARGITARIKPSTDFVSILQNLWWKLDRALDEEIIRYSGLVGALEAIKSGTTSVIDHHASPSFIRGSLTVLRESFEKVGLRGILCYEVTDRNGERGMRDGVEENIKFAESIDTEKRSEGRGLIEALIGAHAPFTLGEEALSMLKDACKDTGRGLHIHVAEDRYDPSYSHHCYSKDVVERLEDFDLLNDKTLCVHGVHLTERDIDRLNAHDSFLAHNARSNMNNRIGYAERLNRFRNVALGTDGIGSNMFEELKFAFFKHRDAGGSLWPGDFLRFLQNGNQLLERNFDCKFGRIEKGNAADCVIYDYQRPTPLVSENIAGHLVFGLASRDVRTVIINGTVCYENRQFPFDVEPIYQKASDAAKRLWKRMDETGGKIRNKN